MPGPDSLAVMQYAEQFSRMGVDNVALTYDSKNKTDVCVVGFKEVSVRGVGYSPEAAMLDASDKIKAAVQERYNITLSGLTP